QIAAAKAPEIGDLGAIDGDEIVPIALDVWIDRGIGGGMEAEEVKGARRRHRHFGRASRERAEPLIFAGGDAALAVHPRTGHAGRPVIDAARFVAERERRRLEAESFHALEEKAEP